jgi:toxin ParE1/3/4
VKALEFVPEAEEDLVNVWHYSAGRWAAAQADTYLNLILDTLDNLASGRVHGQSADDLRKGYARFLVGSHVAFYREASTHVHVIRILHQSMDADQQL